MKKSQEEKANEWMDAQEASPRPGSTFGKQYIPKGVTLNPIVKMVKPESLRPNPRNDFDPLSEEEYASLKENIALNGILDALTARKDGRIVTGENRYRIALELKEHEDENVRRRVENIPVRYYMNELTPEEEYDILEGDNLFRRHLTSEQRKERLKRRILRKYKDELVQDNRGGDRKSEPSKIQSEENLEEEETKQELSSSLEKQTGGMSGSELGLFFGEVGALEEQAKESKQESDLLKNSNSSTEEGKSGSKIQGESLIFSKREQSENLAVKISKNENIPRGTAQRYIAELKKELKTKEPKETAKKEKPAKKEEGKKKTRKQIAQAKAKEFQKKYLKMSYDQKEAALDRMLGTLIRLRKQQTKLNDQVMELHWKDAEIVYQLTAVGQDKRIWKLKV
ncbi:chromosome partitioning protein ParB [Leptospira weilii]|uniref:ParB N-terminal domain-containing protein n=1 Tax=Leptospira weilii TaxID=28184 RepID=UPI001EF366D8|nr:ParB N-terminal domain-containing protein [Leptospira weilii]ULH27602.1 chromosome partitioning protein ParB [Leptospira weilii]ULH27616.1 chromosome partitioning protein ParB [Leptospira weilii]UPY77376.1 chromosome partitioning protein ParB [Leptospira weilii]UPY77399.1 chromosome partitioning protein ParB [Leptospira weilii]